MRNISDKNCRETQNAFYVQQIFFRKSCHLLDNVGKYCTARQVTDVNMAHAHFIPKATNTDREYVIYVAFPQQ
jgi:hypothetical protein